jgi:Tfp pilus assembly protein PilW
MSYFIFVAFVIPGLLLLIGIVGVFLVHWRARRLDAKLAAGQGDLFGSAKGQSSYTMP